MSTIFESKPNQTFIFIDGSYFCFYRYFSLMNWWRNAYPEEPLEDPFQNEKFVEKFRKTFVENVQQIAKKLGISKEIEPILIVGKDCKREHIWRTELFPQYGADAVTVGNTSAAPATNVIVPDASTPQKSRCVAV